MPRVSVDHDVCEANGVCEGLVPEVFQLDDEDILHVKRPEFGEELRAKVRAAVDGCPKVALTMHDDEE